MNQNFAVFLINLDKSVDRLMHATAQLEKMSIDFSRVSAFDGRGIDLNLVDDCDVRFARKYYGRSLIGAEYGCYKSHLECAKKIIEGNYDYAVVLEDDIEVIGDIQSVVNKTILELERKNCDWDLVHLGSSQVRIYTEVSKITQDYKLVAAHYFPQTTHAILWSRKGAERFLSEDSMIKMTVDNHFRHALTRSGRGFAVIPPLVHQSGAESVITGSLKDRRDRDRTWNYGILKQRRFWSNRAIAIFKKVLFKISKV